MTPLRLELRFRESWGLAAVWILALAAYASTLSSSFHLDDYAIFGDAALTAPDGWWRVFRPGQTRPLTYFTFWLNYRLGGSDPWGYHAANLGIHLAVVAAGWAVFRRLLPPLAAWAATAVLALHPLQSEAVAYVFARATLLATLFCLLSWLDWLRDRPWRALLWFVLALLAKEECAAFPIFLAICGAAPEGRDRRRQDWLFLTAMLAVSAAAGGRLLYVAGHTRGAGLGLTVPGLTPWTYLLTQSKVVCRYALLFLWPLWQNFDHHITLFTTADWPWLIAAAGLMALALWRSRWVLGALVLLAPSSSVIPVADLMFEHRVYLPMISLAVFAGTLLGRLRWPVVVGLAVLMTVLAGSRARVWTTEESLWTDANAKSPAKVRPKLHLARAIAQTDPARARGLLFEARRLEPANPETYTQMGTLLLDQRDPAGALAEFDEALRLEPDSADAHSNRGTALYLLGRSEEAKAEFLRALELDPDHANARHNLSLSPSIR